MKNPEWIEQPFAPLFDLKFLNNFDNKLLKLILLETFIRTIPGMCEELKQALKNKDSRTLKDTAHKLKPNIEMMGIIIICEAVRNVEYWPLEKVDNDLKRDVQLIIDILGLVVVDFKLMIARA